MDSRATRLLPGLALLALVLVSLETAHGQTTAQQTLNLSTTISIPPTQSWAHSNCFLLPSYLALTAADAWATQRDQTMRWHIERNPLVPHTTAGRAAYFTGTAAAVVGVSHLLDRKGHRRWAKALL